MKCNVKSEEFTFLQFLGLAIYRLPFITHLSSTQQVIAFMESGSMVVCDFTLTTVRTYLYNSQPLSFSLLSVVFHLRSVLMVTE